MSLPLPFQASDWPREHRFAVQTLWDFHLALNQVTLNPDREDLSDYVEEEKAKATRRFPLKVLPEQIVQPAYYVCEEKKLPLEELVSQIGSLLQMQPGHRFATSQELSTWISGWTGAHARLLMRLAGMKGSWQLHHADQLAEGFFITGRLVTLKEDIEKGSLFIPRSELEKAIISEKNLASGLYNDDMKKLLWKQVVRARDALAQGQPLVHELPRRYVNAFKRAWLAALEVLNVIEKKDFNLWAEPITLNRLHRFQVRFQARFGRASFRKR